MYEQKLDQNKDIDQQEFKDHLKNLSRKNIPVKKLALNIIKSNILEEQDDR